MTAQETALLCGGNNSAAHYRRRQAHCIQLQAVCISISTAIPTSTPRITGYYALYNFKGKKLTKTYQNAFDEVGQNIYSRWINDKEYEYIRCDADGTNKVLFRVKLTLNGGRPGTTADRRCRRVCAPARMSTLLPALTASARRSAPSRIDGCNRRLGSTHL